MRHIALLVEGTLDETVGRRVVEEVGGVVVETYGNQGIHYIKKKIQGFNQLAAGIPILALADLMDVEFNCPAQVVEEWLPHRNEAMLLRLVIREIESWILADRANVAHFLGVPRKQIPRRPEQLDDPKRVVVNLARQSQYRHINELLVPEKGVSASEGPGYTSEMQKFVREDWELEKAAKKSESLARCMTAITRFLENRK